MVAPSPPMATQATGYRTRSVLCAVIKSGDRVRAIVQLLNKQADAEGQV